MSDAFVLWILMWSLIREMGYALEPAPALAYARTVTR